MNKTETKKYVQDNILNVYPVGKHFSEGHLKFMSDLLLNHESAAEKIGVGIKSMWLINSLYGNKCFWLERIDGSGIDFSYLKCLQKRSSKSYFNAALRIAIQPTVIEFKNNCFASGVAVCCPLSGVVIAQNDAHVDHHVPQFVEIVKMFVEEYRIDLKKVEFIEGPEGIGNILKDTELERLWIEFHNKHATLRVISKIENQKREKLKLTY